MTTKTFITATPQSPYETLKALFRYDRKDRFERRLEEKAICGYGHFIDQTNIYLSRNLPLSYTFTGTSSIFTVDSRGITIESDDDEKFLNALEDVQELFGQRLIELRKVPQLRSVA